MLNTGNLTTITSVVASTTPNQESHQFEKTPVWYAQAVVFVFLIIAIGFGNTLVLVATWLDKRLHQPNKYFIACLAVADLLVAFLCIPIRLYVTSHKFIKLEHCQFWLFFDDCCQEASIIALTVISIDRHFKISKPLKYRTQMTTFRAFILISFIWLFSSGFSTLRLFAVSTRTEMVAVMQCIRLERQYSTIIASVVFFFVPTLIITAMYTSIFYIAHKRQKMIRNGALGETVAADHQFQRKALLQDLKIIRMLALVVFTFFVCWAPFFILLLLLNYKEDYIVMSLGMRNLEIVVLVFISILPLFNSLCNPIIYAFFDRQYCKAFKRLLRLRVLSMENGSQ